MDHAPLDATFPLACSTVFAGRTISTDNNTVKKKDRQVPSVLTKPWKLCDLWLSNITVVKEMGDRTYREVHNLLPERRARSKTVCSRNIRNENKETGSVMKKAHLWWIKYHGGFFCLKERIMRQECALVYIGRNGGTSTDLTRPSLLVMALLWSRSPSKQS